MLTSLIQIKNLIDDSFESNSECRVIRTMDLIKHIKLLIVNEYIDEKIGNSIIERKLSFLHTYKFMNDLIKPDTKARWEARKERREARKERRAINAIVKVKEENTTIKRRRI